MCVTNFAKCYEFYSSYFNFHPSEVRTIIINLPFPVSIHQSIPSPRSNPFSACSQ